MPNTTYSLGSEHVIELDSVSELDIVGQLCGEKTPFEKRIITTSTLPRYSPNFQNNLPYLDYSPINYSFNFPGKIFSQFPSRLSSSWKAQCDSIHYSYLAHFMAKEKHFTPYPLTDKPSS